MLLMLLFFKVAFESSVKAGFIINKEINLTFTAVVPALVTSKDFQILISNNNNTLPDEPITATPLIDDEGDLNIASDVKLKINMNKNNAFEVNHLKLKLNYAWVNGNGLKHNQPINLSKYNPDRFKVNVNDKELTFNNEYKFENKNNLENFILNLRPKLKLAKSDLNRKRGTARDLTIMLGFRFEADLDNELS